VLWADGAEYLAAPNEQPGGTKVTPGNHDVVLLLVAAGDHRAIAAAEVRIGSKQPTEWRQVDSLQGVTDAGQIAFTGRAALDRLRQVRTINDAFKDIDATKSWITPCLRYSLTGAGASPSTALDLWVGADGGFPGAVGYDSAGKPADIVMSTGAVPWSLLGLPGKPPAQAAALEPTAAP